MKSHHSSSSRSRLAKAKKQRVLKDESLWGAVKKTVRPIHHNYHHDFKECFEEQNPQHIPPSSSFQKEFTIGETHANPIQKSIKSYPTPHSFSPSTLPPTREITLSPMKKLNPKLRRQLSRGHRPISAQLDLHGMTQHQAQSALRQFVINAFENEIRHVIIITGKGKNSQSDTPFTEAGRGVLREKLPHWLSEKDIATLIVAYEHPPVHHGGEGAFYVHIRRKK